MFEAFNNLNIFHLFNIFIIIVVPITSIHGNLAYGVAGMTSLVRVLISDTHLFTLDCVEVHLFILLPVCGGLS
jgi:phosphate starvation-inducible membrane PsiE